jgi:hypothetical protein
VTPGHLWAGSRGNQFTGPPVGDAIDTLGPGSHLEIQHALILGNDPAGPLEQDP